MITGSRSKRKRSKRNIPRGSENGPRGEYFEWRLAVSDELHLAGFDDASTEFWRCACGDNTFWTALPFILDTRSNAIRAYVCPSHGAKVVRKTCHLRICPDCARRAANRFLARFMPKILECLHSHHPRFRFRKIVLTTPYSLGAPGALDEYRRLKKAIPKMFDLLLGKNWRKTQGVLVADEWGAEGLKLHFHILFYGQWIDNKIANGHPLATAWKAVTGGDCEVAYIAGVSADQVETEIAETLKYCVKFWKTDNHTGGVNRLSPDLMVVLHQMLLGQRRVRSYGVFYHLSELDNRHPCCPVCQRELVRMSISQYNTWRLTGWLPSEQTLYLRTGNKSPPTERCDDGRRPETDNPISANPVQLPLSPEFERSTHASHYDYLPSRR